GNVLKPIARCELDREHLTANFRSGRNGCGLARDRAFGRLLPLATPCHEQAVQTQDDQTSSVHDEPARRVAAAHFLSFKSSVLEPFWTTAISPLVFGSAYFSGISLGLGLYLSGF